MVPSDMTARRAGPPPAWLHAAHRNGSRPTVFRWQVPSGAQRRDQGRCSPFPCAGPRRFRVEGWTCPAFVKSDWLTSRTFRPKTKELRKPRSIVEMHEWCPGRESIVYIPFLNRASFSIPSCSTGVGKTKITVARKLEVTLGALIQGHKNKAQNPSRSVTVMLRHGPLKRSLTALTTVNETRNTEVRNLSVRFRMQV